MFRLVQADRKVTVTEIITIYNRNAQHFEPWSRCITAVEDHTRWHSYQIKTKNWVLQVDKRKLENVSCLMSIGYCYDMVGLEFVLNNKCSKCNKCILLCINGSRCCWYCNDMENILLADIVILGPIKDRLNVTAYLSIKADHMSRFRRPVHPFSVSYFQ